jgi:hypothetical protein
MTIYKQGDVLLVPYPFTDQSGTKQHPATEIGYFLLISRFYAE